MKLISNYHTHTCRCGHASGTDREYIENAIKCGIKNLGFSDHTAMPPASNKDHRISEDSFAEYFESLNSLREEYKDRINIEIGVETECYPDIFPEYLDYLSAFPCEYMILGQHTVMSAEGYFCFDPTDDENMLCKYYENLLWAVSAGKFRYIAHPDIFHFTGSEKIYEKRTLEFLTEIGKTGLPLEINGLGVNDKRYYPNGVFWELAAECGNSIIIGLDAHSPGSLSDEYINNTLNFAIKTGIEPEKIINISGADYA